MTTYRAHSDLERRSDRAVYRYFTDFMTYTAGDWTLTTVEAGAGDATEALATNRGGGWLTITNDAGANDADSFQLLPADGHFRLALDKAFGFKLRFELADVLQSVLVGGLIVTDTDPFTGVTDGVYFTKDDGDNQLDLVVVKGSAATRVNDVARLTNGVPVEVEIYYGGDANNGKVGIHVNGTRVGGAVATNLPTALQLRPTFGLKNGEAVAKVMHVDFVEAYAER